MKNYSSLIKTKRVFHTGNNDQYLKRKANGSDKHRGKPTINIFYTKPPFSITLRKIKLLTPQESAGISFKSYYNMHLDGINLRNMVNSHSACFKCHPAPYS